MEGITFTYPTWLVLVCIAVGIIYGLLHYLGSRQFSDKGPWLKKVLFALRATAVALLSILLLGPLLRYYINIEEEPVLIVALDNSESLKIADDSLALNNLYEQLGAFSENISGNIQIDYLLFGEEVRPVPTLDPDFSDRSTDLSGLLEYINNTYDGRNLAGAVIATDGIYNQGANPIYTGSNHTSPLHFVTLGDTSVRRDLLIRRILHNRLAYLGEKFSIQVDVAATMANGKSSELRIFSIGSNGDRELLHAENIDIDKNDFFYTAEVVLDADNPGLQRYQVTLTSIENEVSTDNNSRDFYVEILDNREKILILGATPHPDLGTIKTLLEGYKNYEVELHTIADWEGDFDEYSLIVLHQIPSSDPSTLSVLENALAEDDPLLFILGTQSNINRFNQAQNLLDITGGGNRQNDATPVVNDKFNPFSFDSELYNRLQSFVPLQSPFGEYALSPAANTLLFQRIGQVDTEMPLLTMGEIENRRIGIIAGEGIWKWRLYEFSSFDQTEATSDLLLKTLQYLSIRDDDRRLRVYSDDNLYSENEVVTFEAEYYNASMQRINEADVSLTISDREGNQYSYNFDRRDDHYILQTGPFNPGDYRYIAEVSAGMEQFRAEGGFTVSPLQLESINLEANHELLRQLAGENNGRVFHQNDSDQLTNLLNQESDFKPIIHSTLRTNLVLNLFWICLSLMLLLFAEWFLRRYFGRY